MGEETEGRYDWLRQNVGIGLLGVAAVFIGALMQGANGGGGGLGGALVGLGVLTIVITLIHTALRLIWPGDKPKG